MKKLLFSAIALVAFNGVSMGNTIEVEKDSLVSKIVVIEEDKGDGCQEFAMDLVTFAVSDDDNLTDAEYNAVFQSFLNYCYNNMSY
jgi:flagellar hook assembly protein FlgD